MKEKYLQYYSKYSSWASLAFLWDACLAKSKARKASLLNRQRDYVNLFGNERLLRLHSEINRLLLRGTQEWGSYDYGEGYFYQGLDSVGITGLRDTRARIEEMELGKLLRGKRVLDIGCNSGFLSLAIAEKAEHVTGFDVNPLMVEIGRVVGAYLGHRNIDLLVSGFEDFQSEEPFDVVMSLANHSTYDGNTKQTVKDYFARCGRFLKPNGLLVFESHGPSYEGGALESVCSIIEESFDVIERRVLTRGSYLDRGRTFMVATKVVAETRGRGAGDGVEVSKGRGASSEALQV